jgi:hypothetical protein
MQGWRLDACWTSTGNPRGWTQPLRTLHSGGSESEVNRSRDSCRSWSSDSQLPCARSNFRFLSAVSDPRNATPALYRVPGLSAAGGSCLPHRAQACEHQKQVSQTPLTPLLQAIQHTCRRDLDIDRIVPLFPAHQPKARQPSQHCERRQVFIVHLRQTSHAGMLGQVAWSAAARPASWWWPSKAVDMTQLQRHSLQHLIAAGAHCCRSEAQARSGSKSGTAPTQNTPAGSGQAAAF